MKTSFSYTNREKLMIYLDNAATTKVREEVKKEMLNCMENYYANADSTHDMGLDIARLINNRKKIFNDLLGLNKDDIYFTAGGGEGNNLLIQSVVKANKKAKIITTKIEHPSVYETIKNLNDYEVYYVKVDSYGFVDIDDLVKNVDEMFYYYDGSKVFLDSWAKDSNLRYAIKVSQVPAYKKLARELGKERMQEGLNKLNYGNKEIGSEIDKFWLEGPLKISAMEQVKLLNLLSQSKLPFKLENQEQVKDITILEKKDDFILHGKTGWATDNIVVPIGWFVGWIETSDNIYSFAINLDISDSKFLPKREEIVREYFKNINVIK